MYATHDDIACEPIIAARPTGGATATVATAMKGWLRRWRMATSQRAAMRTLEGLDAHMLRDIGANRADLERLVREGR